MSKRFRVVLEKHATSEATSIEIPFDVEKEFGRRGRVPVRGTINKYPFRSSIFSMKGKHFIPVNRQLREGARAVAGDTVSVTLERDDEPRIITPPEDLARALKSNPQALAAWDRLSYTHKKEFALVVEEAKRPETRQRRIEKTLFELCNRGKSRD